MSDGDKATRPTVPKFSSFKAKSDTIKELKAPKFSSFRPKEPQGDTRDATTDGAQDRDRDSRKRSHHSHSDRSHHSKHRRHDSPGRHRDRGHNRSRSQSTTHDERPKPNSMAGNKTGEPNLFTIDTKGDPLITKYGGIDRSQIPAYYRYGSGRVLGTVGRLVIHRDGPRDKFSLRMPGEGSAAFQDKDGLRSKHWRVRSKPTRIRKEAASTAEDEAGDFILIRPSKKRKQEHKDSDSSDEEQPSYRSIEGKAKPHQYSDSDLEYETDSGDEALDVDQNNPLKWKSIQLSQRVKDQPQDIDSWLELVDHQDTLLRAGEDVDHKALEGEVHSYAEIKLSMLESALANVSKPEDRERVLVRLMHEGVKVWNTKTAANKWSELVSDEDDNFALWKTHLDFAASSITTFQYEDIKNMCQHRILQAITSPEYQSNQKYSEAIYVFLRLTRLIHDAGYMELAVAAWQGILELNCFQAQGLEGEWLEHFQEFWESEVPRIGEPDAKGWWSFSQSGGVGDPPAPLGETAEPDVQSRDAYKSWACLEQARGHKSKMPARTMDEGTEDDPFRVVMVSDLYPLLFKFPGGPHTKELFDAFLIFCRLPPAFRSSEWIEAAYHDQFLMGTRTWASSLEPKESAEKAPEDIEVQRKPLSFDQGCLHAAPSPDLFFSHEAWFSYLPKSTQDEVVPLSFVVNVAKLLTHDAPYLDMAQYYLALCSIQEGVAIRKAAKAILKQYPNIIRNYNDYALAEFRQGKPDVAAKVLGSAIELALSRSSSETIVLWRTWSWIELEMGNKKLAMKRLCSSGDETLRKSNDDVEISPTQVLKAHQYFLDYLDTFLARGDVDIAGLYGECLGLLSYLATEGCSEPMSPRQGNITASMAAMKRVSEEFKRRGHGATLAHERILQFAARMLYLNASRGPFRRAYLLEQFSGFIESFPRNTIFLSLFEWADSSLRVIDGVRTLLYDKVLVPKVDNVGSRMFAIQHEIQRGNTNTAKAAFEHALSSDACKYSVPLWVAYVRFCSLQRELRPKAKDVFFRALRNCPGSKDVMMEAFLTLNRAMESSDLRSVFNTMATKGLRVHVDLDEYLEKRRGKKEKERR